MVPAGDIRKETVAGPGRVQQPGPYALRIFVVTPADAERILSGVSYRRAAWELTCSGGSCAEVSSALYLRPVPVNDPQVLTAAIRTAFIGR